LQIYQQAEGQVNKFHRFGKTLLELLKISESFNLISYSSRL